MRPARILGTVPTRHSLHIIMHMFARARILLRTTAQAVLVPEEAISEVEAQPLVFVALADDLFEARAVRLGAIQNSKFNIVLRASA